MRQTTIVRFIVALVAGLISLSTTSSAQGTQRALGAPAQVTLVTLQPSQVAGIVAATTTRMTTTGLDPFVSADILVNIANGGAATGTLQIFIEDSVDNGTTWDDVAASNTVSFGSSASTQRFIIAGTVATSATQGSAAAAETLTAGTVRAGPFGNQIRIREKVSGVSGSPVGPTYTISGIFKR